MTDSTIAPLYEDTRATAARFGLSEATLATLRCRGGGPRYSKIGSRVVYKVADVAAWLEAGARANTSQS